MNLQDKVRADARTTASLIDDVQRASYALAVAEQQVRTAQRAQAVARNALDLHILTLNA